MGLVLAGWLLLSAAVAPGAGRATALDLAAVSCAKYENEVLASAVPSFDADPIDTVMWLFGFSVARSGEHAMYGDSLTAFGFALDAECKNNPNDTLLQAVSTVKSKRDNPMDLTRLDCATFETRHTALRKSDLQSANTLAMWLFGYAVGVSGGHVLDAAALPRFESELSQRCAQHPDDSLSSALMTSAATPHGTPGAKVRPKVR